MTAPAQQTKSRLEAQQGGRTATTTDAGSPRFIALSQIPCGPGGLPPARVSLASRPQQSQQTSPCQPWEQPSFPVGYLRFFADVVLLRGRSSFPNAGSFRCHRSQASRQRDTQHQGRISRRRVRRVDRSRRTPVAPNPRRLKGSAVRAPVRRPVYARATTGAHWVPPPRRTPLLTR